MSSWLAIGVIAGALTAIGNAIDHLLVRRQKRVLYEKMVVWWIKLAETRFPVLHTRMASNALSYFSRLTNGRLRVSRLCLLAIVGTWLLTSGSAFIGTVIDEGIAGPFRTSGIPLPIFTVYLANFPFDLATVAVTYFALKLVARSRPLKGILVICLDLAAAYALAVLAWVFIVWGEDLAMTYEMPGTRWGHEALEERVRAQNAPAISAMGFSEQARIRVYQFNERTGFAFLVRIAPQAFRSAWRREPVSERRYVKIVVTEGERTVVRWGYGHFTARWSHVAMAYTTFVPTGAYMIYLLFLLVGRIMIETLRLASMQFLEVATEADPTETPKDFIPGTLFGAAIGIMAAIANAIVKLVGN